MAGMGVLETEVKPSTGVRVGRVIGIALVVLVALAVIGGLSALSIYLLFFSWQIGDWMSFWTVVGMTALIEVIAIPMVGVGLIYGTGFAGAASRAARDRDDLVRRLLLAANNESAPPEPLQPAPLALPSQPNVTLTIPLATSSAPKQGRSQGIRAMLLLLYVVCVVPFFSVVLLSFPGTPTPPLPIIGGLAQFGITSFLGSCGVFAVIVIFGLGAAIQTSLRRMYKGVPVQVSDEGLRWSDRRTHRRELLRWSEIGAIGRSAMQGPAVSNSTTTATVTQYMLAGTDQALVWNVAPYTRPHLFQASETLLRLVVTRTGQPLRDASKLAAEVTLAGANARFLLESRLAGSSASMSTLSATPRTKAGGPARWGCLGVALLLAVLLLIQAGVGGVGFYYQQQHSAYVANLPGLIHQTQPLFADSLMASDGLWYEQKPSEDDLAGMAYTPNGYQLSGNKPGNFVLSTGSQHFGDNMAYEVIATQRGALPQDGGDGVGIAFNADDIGDQADSFIEFSVGYDGGWYLMSYKYVDDRTSDNWNYIDQGTSSVINKNPGDTNTLLIVVRGTQYILYINNQYITTYNDTYDKGLPTSGFAGVYLDDCAMTGTFRDFNAYPVKPITTSSFTIA